MVLFLSAAVLGYAVNVWGALEARPTSQPEQNAVAVRDGNASLPRQDKIGPAIEAIHSRLAQVSAATNETQGARRTLSSKRSTVAEVPATAAQITATPGDHLVVLGTGQTAQGSSLCAQPSGNCQAQDNSEALVSDRTNYLVADDFRPSVDGTISGVCWRGAYFSGTSDCRGVSPDNFRIKYFYDDGGAPWGNGFRQYSQSYGQLTVSGPVATGAMIANRVPEYEYTATHAPVSVTAGRCYWIEISNELTGCTWYWEAAAQGDHWAMQDGDGTNAPDGYNFCDSAAIDMAYCVGIGLADPGLCVPPPPDNDNCASARPIQGTGVVPFDNSTATTDGTPHDACLAWRSNQIESDVWYCWTAPCTDTVFVSTCGQTDVDTRIAVYDGCGCLPPDQNMLACNDDICGAQLDPRQSMVYFGATAGRQYLIRVGNYPGERRCSGSFAITCGPPDNAACPGAGDCCQAGGTPGCSDGICCETVCACDPFCCLDFWDASCATYGFQNSGCGALLVCGDLCGTCGKPDAGSCCAGHTTPGCSDLTCCDTVCARDAFCCEVEWDQNCATRGVQGNGNGAQALCPDLCPTCPEGPVVFVDPPSGVIDARQPYPPNDASARQGIASIVVQGPAGIGAPGCWSLCETAADGLANDITGVADNGDGTFTAHLTRSITTGAVTTVTYTAGGGTKYMGTFTSHPANVNGDSASGPTDILAIIDALNGVTTPPWGIYSKDLDHSGVAGPADILSVIDLLNGADQFDPWLGRSLPQCGACCP